MDKYFNNDDFDDFLMLTANNSNEQNKVAAKWSVTIIATRKFNNELPQILDLKK